MQKNYYAERHTHSFTRERNFRDPPFYAVDVRHGDALAECDYEQWEITAEVIKKRKDVASSSVGETH